MVVKLLDVPVKTLAPFFNGTLAESSASATVPLVSCVALLVFTLAVPVREPNATELQMVEPPELVSTCPVALPLVEMFD